MTSALVAGHRHHVGRTWFAMEIAYVVLIAALAAAGMTAESHRILLVVAGLLALPSARSWASTSSPACSTGWRQGSRRTASARVREGAIHPGIAGPPRPERR